MSINTLTFTTRFGQDGELRATASGTSVLSVRCPLESGWGDKKTTSWVTCALFGKRADALAPYIKKGGQATIQGALRVREFEHNGEKRTAVEVLVDEIELQGGKQEGGQQAQQKPQGGGWGGPADFDDDGPAF